MSAVAPFTAEELRELAARRRSEAERGLEPLDFTPPELTPEESARIEAAAKREAIEKRREAWRRIVACVPDEYRWALDAGVTHEDAQLARAIARLGEHWAWPRIEEYARSRKFLVLGGAGAGKTSLVVRMLRPWFERTYVADTPVDDQPSVMFIDAFELADARSQHGLGKGESKMVTRALGVDLLILDELGMPIVEPMRSPIAEIIFGRHNAGLATWCTSALPLQGEGSLTEKYGAGLLRRVAEQGRAKVVQLGKPSAPAGGMRAPIARGYDAAMRRSGDDS